MGFFDRPFGTHGLILRIAPVVIIFCVTALIEHAFGRPTICTCGKIRLWIGSIHSPELSQQLSDAYSFSHVIHGFIFYGICAALRSRWPTIFYWRAAAAAFLEASWEVLENSPIIIARYRQTVAQGYVGDSILNSMSDIACCMIGLWLARRLPAWLTVTLALLTELIVGALIRDNLLLNIIMLAHPFQSIKHWQAGA